MGVAIQQTISPIDGRVIVERPYASAIAINAALDAARRAQLEWQATPIESRCAVLRRFCAAFEAAGDEIAPELTRQMGRPIAYAPNEVRGTLERARYMISIAASSLADIDAGPQDGLRRFVRRVPLGTVLIIAAWNYPYLIAVNGVVPALLAGNAVILKHSAQTPLCAERFAQALHSAGLPTGLFHALHVTHADTAKMIADPRINYVNFTGSVDGGHAVQKAASERFIATGLELGGNDPAYVRHDADLDHAVENLVDGAFFNSGQSCCGIARIYVHESSYERFVAAARDLTMRYRLGDPLDPATTLGPVVRVATAERIRQTLADAVARGATPLIDERAFPQSRRGTAYLAPQILVDVDHSMPVVHEEIFGPVVSIMKVRDDEEAVRLMNDSSYGLTAAIWTRDHSAALALGERVETGTWFMNRCDYLDPALAWVGVKNSGRGCTLSRVGYEHLTRPKSFYLRLRT